MPVWVMADRPARCYVAAMASFLSSILLPIAVAAVALVLLLGLLNMMRGGSPNRSQKLMRLRVLLQFVAIVITMLAVWAMRPLKERTMVVLNRIYTRTGDDGTTALGSGERRPKYDLRIAAYGTVDETNAAIGIVRLHLADARELDAMLGLIQNDLFDLGADLAVPEREGKAERLRVLASQVERLERDIDALNAQLAPLTSFVLPGGTPAAAHLHLARTICRRAERIMVELAARPGEPVSDAAIQYMNRLSDFLFVASRAVNNNGAGDVLWVPGQNR